MGTILEKSAKAIVGTSKLHNFILDNPEREEFEGSPLHVENNVL